MTIKQEKNGSVLTLALGGRLDTMTSPMLEEVINDLDGVKELVIDLEKTEYVSSAGLRVLLKAQKRMSGQGGMKVTHVNDIVMEVFEVTGFSEILTIE